MPTQIGRGFHIRQTAFLCAHSLGHMLGSFQPSLKCKKLLTAGQPWIVLSNIHTVSTSEISYPVPALGVSDMPNPNRYDILSISIFCKIPLSISISISIFSRMAISISISISIFFKLSLSISIFSKFPYRYFYRYRYFPNFLIDIFSISIFSK